MAQIATVVAVTGKAFAIGMDGKIRAIRAGDPIEQDEIIQTAAGGHVELKMIDGQTMAVAPEHALKLDESVAESDQRPTAQDSALTPATANTVIQALERGDDLNADLDPPAAGLDAGGPGQGNAGFVRLLRVSEGVDPLAYEFTAPALPEVQGIPSLELALALDTLSINVGAPTTGLGDITVNEGDNAVFSVHTTGAAEGSTLSLAFSAAGQSPATLGTDYKANTFEYSLDSGLTWQSATEGQPFAVNAGASTVLVRTDTVNDAIAEGNEGFALTATIHSGGVVVSDSGIATIIDNDTPSGVVGGPEGSKPDVGMDNFTVVEGQDAVFTVTVNQAAVGSTLNLNLGFGSDTAQDADYNEGANQFQYRVQGTTDWLDTTGAIALANGGNYVFEVRTNTVGDSVDEPNEAFSLNASLQSGTLAVADRGTATIIDNDEPSVVVGGPGGGNSAVGVDNFNVPEGQDTVFTVTVNQSAAGSLLNLSLGFDSDTAQDADYQEGADAFQYRLQGTSTWLDANGAITLAEGGNYIFEVRTNTVDDSVDEPNETFSLNASLQSGTPTVADRGTATIIDNDEPKVSVVNPAIGVDNITVNEGQDAVFTVTVRQSAAGSLLNLNLGLGGDTATHVADYDAGANAFHYRLQGTTDWLDVTGAIALTNGGNYVFEVRSNTVNDTLVESSEVFSLNASLLSGVTTVDDRGTATIIDNDIPNRPPSISTDPGNEGSNDVVYEAGLAAGSGAGPLTTLVGGTFTVSDPDGLSDLQSVTINATTILMANLGANNAIVGTNGTLTVSAYNSLTGVATYTYQLTSPTTDLAGTESNVFTLTTSDGTTSSAPATITIHIVDDQPLVVADAGSVTEDTVLSTSGNVLSNDTSGADIPKSFVSWNSTLSGSWGTLVDNGAGGYTYNMNNAAVQFLDSGETRTDNFAYTMKDADGDQKSSTLTITIFGTNDAPTITAGQTKIISEEGLLGANPDSGGTPMDTTNSRTTSGLFTFADVDAKTLTVSLAAPLGGFTSGNQAITWTLTHSGHTLTGSTVTTTIIVISIDDTGAYNVTLSGQIDHSAPPIGSSVENLINLTVGVSVTDGSLSAQSTLMITVEDDSPIVKVTPGHFQNSTHTVLNGTLALIGADSHGADVNITGITPPTDLSSGGVALVYISSPDGSTITATAGASGPLVFTMHGNADGTYVFTQSALLDLSVLTSDLQSSVGAGGPQPAYYLYSDGSFGTVENAKDWAVKVTGSDLINPSTQGMGVQNNLFQGGETMHFEFDDEGASTFGGGSAPNLAYLAKITFNGLDAGEGVAYTVHFTVGADFSGVATSLNTVGGILTITAPSGAFIDYIDFAPQAGTTLRMTSVSTFVLDEAVTKNISFAYNAVDGDGDTVSGTVVITAQNSHTLIGTNGVNDALGGGTGYDTLSGAGGNDILTGSTGDDTLTGGAGSDTFVWTLNETGSDKIIDFTLGPVASGGDVLDLRDLLQGETPGANNTAANSLDQYLHFDEVAGKAVLQIDPNAGAFVPTQTINFDNMSLATLKASLGVASGASDLEIIQKMLTDGNLNNS